PCRGAGLLLSRPGAVTTAFHRHYLGKEHEHHHHQARPHHGGGAVENRDRGPGGKAGGKVRRQLPLGGQRDPLRLQRRAHGVRGLRPVGGEGGCEARHDDGDVHGQDQQRGGGLPRPPYQLTALLSSPSSAGATSRPNTSPTSNSSHIGIASSDWDSMSGGVSSMPTTKQHTTT